jgi:hypothetical protein
MFCTMPQMHLMASGMHTHQEQGAQTGQETQRVRHALGGAHASQHPYTNALAH